jgi:cell shape-determining protein MreC
MDYGKLIAILFSATGFWRLAELLMKRYSGKRKEVVELNNIQAQTESSVIKNWIQWSQTLEKRVKELEAVAEENKELKKQIEGQRVRIVELESKVQKVEKENESLLTRLRGLSKS